MLVIK